MRKLRSLMKEQMLNEDDSESFNTLDEFIELFPKSRSRDELARFLAEISKGMKLKKSIKKNSIRFNLLFSNEMLDMAVSVLANTDKTGFLVPDVDISPAVKLLVDQTKGITDENFENMKSPSSFFSLDSHTAPDFKNESITKENIASIRKAINHFTEWYMDLVSEFGQVKLLHGYTDLVTDVRSTGSPRLVAFAGDFRMINDKAESRIFS